MEQFEKVLARFNPKRTDNLKSHCIKHIGNVYEFMPMWVIEEGDYVGQFAMQCEEMYTWCPSEDLEIIEVIG